MKYQIVVALSVTLALAIPSAAQAALPKTTNTLIVPAKSIGGVALGGSPTAVSKAWGKNGACETSCAYEGKNTGELADALLESKGNGAPYKVWRVVISVSQVSAGSGSKFKPNFKTPLTQFKTAKGIGLGSTVKELRQAYHQAKKESTVYILAGPGESMTIFGISEEGRIDNISISSHPGG